MIFGSMMSSAFLILLTIMTMRLGRIGGVLRFLSVPLVRAGKWLVLFDYETRPFFFLGVCLSLLTSIGIVFDLLCKISATIFSKLFLLS